MKKDFLSDALRSGLKKKTHPLFRLLMLAAATAIFFAFAMSARYAKMDNYYSSESQHLSMLLLTAGAYAAIFAVSYAIQLHIGKDLSLGAQIMLGVITGVILLAKISLLDYNSDDYDIFLSNWIVEYLDMDLKQGLGWYIGSDYTPPYLYLLLLISRTGSFPWLYLIKAFSIFMDVILGYAIARLASLKLKGITGILLMFHIAQILPTVVFNGAYWGQCDVFYTSLSLLALYDLLRGRSARAMVFFGIALSFKLQMVFFLPAFLPLWLRKDLKLRHLVLIPVTYMVMMIPALWAGKSLHHVLTVYAQQASHYNMISFNAPTLYQFLPIASVGNATLYKLFSNMAIMLGLTAMAGLCLLVLMNREKLTCENTLLWAVMILAVVPFLLPKMHERYLFGADVASLVLCVWKPRRIVLPLLFGFASYIGYTAGLAGEQILPMVWGAIFEMTGIILLGIELYRSMTAPEAAEMRRLEVKA